MSILDITSYRVNVSASRTEMGEEAGKKVEEKIVELLKSKKEITMVFAAAPSQNELLDYLVSSKSIEWQKIIAFHMDEYIGLSTQSAQSFSYFLNHKFFSKVPFKQVHLINGTNPVKEETEKYTKLLKQAPIDIICLGIGENGHIAFNDPSMADFNDPQIVKSVTLDLQCRQQQVNEGCFKKLEDVPQQAITLTIPTLMSADYLFCVVPGDNKRNAVNKALSGPVETSCPASVLRTHPSCEFFLDSGSYGK